MIPQKRWEKSLQEAITDPAELLKALALDDKLLPDARRAADLFPLKVPLSYVNRIQPGNRHDPLLLQVLPIVDELIVHPDYTADPLNEKAANPVPGLLHKYPGRVLLTFVGTCAINCRYCFRRQFPYAENNPGRGWDQALAYIAQDTTICEVILSGGDPLIAPDKLLTAFSEKLSRIPHVRRLRIHTRLPIVMPERITAQFLKWIGELKFQTILVVHCNHAQEINDEVSQGLSAIKAAGVTLLNQSVILKGVNNSVAALQDLSEGLFKAGVQPYYLHLLDKVSGSAHFDIPKAEAILLHQKLTAQLSGFLVPKLVFEEAGALSKMPVF